MSNIGIKVVNAGTSIQSNDPRDIILSSKYSMFKYHYDGTISLTVNPGDTDVYGTVAHNLGYIPASMSYVSYPDTNLQTFVPEIPYGVDLQRYSSAKMGTSNLVVGFHLAEPYNQFTYDINDYWSTRRGANYFDVGKYSDGNTMNGATRFTNINLNKNESYISANLDVLVGSKGTASTDTKFNFYGIDEDNTSSFGDPMGRDRTTSTQSKSQSLPPINNYFGIDVHNEVNEIISRAGWSNGNAIGFLFFNNNSDTGAYFGDALVLPASKLTITKSGSMTITFKVIIFKDRII